MFVKKNQKIKNIKQKKKVCANALCHWILYFVKSDWDNIAFDNKGYMVNYKKQELPKQCFSKVVYNPTLFDNKPEIHKKLIPYYGIDNFDMLVDAKYADNTTPRWVKYSTVVKVNLKSSI